MSYGFTSAFATPSVSTHGRLRDTTQMFADSELIRYGFASTSVHDLMRKTGIQIGGGFTTNVLVKEARHPVKPLPEGADIDFYVYGCLPPPLPASYDYRTWTPGNAGLRFTAPEAAKYFEDTDIALRNKAAVFSTFTEFAKKAGYRQVTATEEDISSYLEERTSDGDRLFTSTGKVKYALYFFSRKTESGVEQKLNLVMVDTPISTIQTKVDIGLTAGMLSYDYFGWKYTHPAPQVLIDLRVSWLQPESTHTERQKKRLLKYSERYGVDPHFAFTVPQFLAEYDSLPDKCDVLIRVKPSEMTKGLKRRVKGMQPDAAVMLLQVLETTST